MTRALNEKFFKWLQTDPLKLLDTIFQYDCLDIQLSNGNALKVYFKGFLILTVTEKKIENNELRFKVLDSAYLNAEGDSCIKDIINQGVGFNNLQEYLDWVIGFLSRRNNTRVEESIRQEIARVNNRSNVAQDTDYFIVSEEYKVYGPKLDLVAIKWPSKSEIRKKFNSKLSNLEIVVFELKHGKNAIGGTNQSTSCNADLKKHFSDFQAVVSDEALLFQFKLDIIKMFVQQASLKGFFDEGIKGLKHVIALSNPWNQEEIQEIASNIPVKFGMIISDYKQESNTLKAQIDQIPDDFIFSTSSFMGYGLFEKSMLNKNQLLELLK